MTGNFTQAQIVSINPNKSGGSPEVLTGDFYSAQSPVLSFEATHLIFTARKNQNDPWQIYEMNLADSKIRQITSSDENCIDPAYLPGDRLVFSKFSGNDTLKAGHSLFTCRLNGSDLKQITFNPDAWFGSTVLKDGRVLSVSSQLFPDKKNPLFMVLRPDGTKAELFYKSSDGNKLLTHGLETKDGRILFIESDSDKHSGGNVISISYNRPLHSRVNLTSQIQGSFYNVFPVQSGKLLVSYRKSESERYALYDFDPDNNNIGNVVYSSKDFDILDAVVVEKHERPKNLPSEVDMGVKTGLILCQDINVGDMQLSGNTTGLTKISGIQVTGRDSTLGIVQVLEDGSFYLKVIADTPFKIQTIDEKGRVLNESCGWIWLRPNERRGCVGCHENPEIVPVNKVPLSVKNRPFNIPVHINKVVEKKVSLE